MEIVKDKNRFSIFENGKEISFLQLKKLNYSNDNDCYVVEEVFTEPSFRKHGFAGSLYKEMFKFVKENSFRLFRGAHLDETNKFYEENGCSFVPSNLPSAIYKEEIILP